MIKSVERQQVKVADHFIHSSLLIINELLRFVPVQEVENKTKKAHLCSNLTENILVQFIA